MAPAFDSTLLGKHTIISIIDRVRIS